MLFQNPARSRYKSFVSFVCFVIAFWLIVSLNFSIWLNRTVFNTNQFVATTAPLIKQPDVQAQLAKAFADNIVKSAGADQAVQQLSASVPGVNAQNVTQQIQQSAQDLLASPKFQSVWEQTIRQAHGTFTQALNTDSPEVKVDIAPLYANLQSALQGTPLAAVATTPLPPQASTVTIKNTAALKQAQQRIKMAQIMQVITVAIIMLMVAGGTVLAANRLRALASFLLLLAVLLFGGVALLQFVTSRLNPAPGTSQTAASVAKEVITVVAKPLYKQTELLALAAGITGVVLAVLSVIAGRSHTDPGDTAPPSPTGEPLHNDEASANQNT
jgi:hypothetical protein